MNSTPPSDEIPPAGLTGPVLFQPPPRGPGRPPSTSTSEPPPSSTHQANPSGPEASSTSPDPDWSTRNHPDDGDERPASGPSSGSLGSEIGAEALSGLRGTIAAGIINVTEAAHNIVADDIGRHFNQFLASDVEIKEISDAGARILSRKLPKGLGNRDVEDVIRVAIAAAAYVGRQVKILSQSRAARRQLKAAAAAAGPHGGEQPA